MCHFQSLSSFLRHAELWISIMHMDITLNLPESKESI